MGVGEGCHHTSLPHRTPCRFNVLHPSLSLLGAHVRLCTFLILPALGIWAVPREGQKEADVGEGKGLGACCCSSPARGAQDLPTVLSLAPASPSPVGRRVLLDLYVCSQGPAAEVIAGH